MLPSNKITPVRPVRPHVIITDPDVTPVILEDVVREMGMSGPKVPAEQLVDHTLTILRAKPFMSSFDEEREAWFCVVRDHETNAQVTTVIGGQACTEILDAYAASGATAPLTVVLRKVDGGRYGRYYQFE